MTTQTIEKSKPNVGFFRGLLIRRSTSLIIAILLAIAFTCIVLEMMNADPVQVFKTMWQGAFGSWDAFTQVLQAWVPLILATMGLMFTFTAGLWNIGMEGQIEMGAIFSYAVIRHYTGTATPGGLVIVLAFLSGILGGMIWALLVGLLKNYGNVNEIFGGLGFNFIADAILLFLVYGPWKPPGVAQGSTKMLDAIYWLPQLKSSYLSLWALAVAIIGVIVVTILLKGTYFGLKLKAVGKNPKSSFMLGIPTSRYMLLAFALCGVFAGLVGALQVTGFQHVLRNSISGGYGYMGLMVGMLSNLQPLLAVPIAFIFIAISKGAAGLAIDMQLDTNLAGVIQGTLVLCVMIMNGVRTLLIKKSRGS
jgi:simple sugar transport system permease protein